MHSTAEAVSLLVLLILGLGFFTLSEASIVSSRRSRLKDLADQGDRGAPHALKLSEEPDRFLTMIRLGFVAIGILAGFHGGAALVAPISQRLERVPALEQFAGVLGSGLVAAGLIAAAIVFGEIVPRQLAVSAPERVACRVSRPIRVLALLLVPLERRLGAAVQSLMSRLGIRPSAEPPVVEEEIKILLRERTRAGAFEEAEQQLIERVIRFYDRRAKAVMTPRDQIVWIDVADSPEEKRRKAMEHPYSRFPVCDQSLDNLLGVIEAKHLLATASPDEPFRVRGGLGMPIFLYEKARGARVLELFRKAAIPLAVALDEFGSVAGILTHTDILRGLVGDVSDRRDDEDERLDADCRAGGARMLDGRLPLDEFAALLTLPEFPREEYDTLGGFVVANLGRLPQVGDSFDWLDLRFEVVRMAGKRVDKIRMSPRPGERAEAP